MVASTNAPVTYGDSAGPVFLDLIKSQLDEERNRKSSLEQRGITVITTSSTLVTLLFAFTALATKANPTYVLATGARGWLFVSLMFFVAAAVAGLVSNWTLSYVEVDALEFKNLLQTRWNDPTTEVAERVAMFNLDVIEGARGRNNLKSNAVRVGITLELFAIATLAISVSQVLR